MARPLRCGRRAVIFTLDAVLAAILLVSGLVLIASISEYDSDTVQLQSAGHDVMAALGEVRIDELRDPWILARITDGSIADPNVTALEQIGYFWAIGQDAEAQQLATILLNSTYPGYGLRLTADGSIIYNRSTPQAGDDVIAASRMVSGIAQGQAVTGSSAVAYLRRIKDKRTSSFTTFGGFVGQGNISVKFIDLPADAAITDISLEMAAGSPFSVYFNNVLCGAFTPADTNGTPTLWNLTSCSGSIVNGSVNNVSVRFTGPLNESYVSGGFLQVKYKTEIPLTSLNTTFEQYRFPGIDGIVNLYDAFYVPGTLRNMSIYLHYNTSNSTYLDIAEKRVWVDEANGTERKVVLNDSYLRDPLGGRLDYGFLSNKTVPLRMAGFSPAQTVVTSGDADVVFITDFSGSMKKAVSGWDQGNLGGTCATAYADSDVRRTLLAQCVDKELVDVVMNYSGNRMWPVFLHNDQVKWYNNPTNKAAIKGYVDSYPNGDGKTCISCAINMAYDILANNSNASRKKFIVLMTDGTPTHCAAGSCMSTSVAYGAQQCEGLCDVSGQNCGDVTASCNACAANPGGMQNAEYSAQRAVDGLNVTIFTVGFGPVDACSYGAQTLQEIADIGNGTYQHSTNSSQLLLIYQNISLEILSRTTLVSQVAITEGAQADSRLYDDSHINITYELAQQYLPQQNAISITLKTPQACNPVLPLYPEQQLVEAKTVSYSGIHWTDYVGVRNESGPNVTEVYNLSSFLVPYDSLGDPTVVYMPIGLFTQGDNDVVIETGDSPVNRTGCSANNSIIYTVVVNLSTERSTVVPDAQGCVWTVQFDDDSFENISIPAAYGDDPAESNRCSYTAANLSYDPSDAYQLGAYTIFNRLDFRKQQKLFVNLRDEDLEVIVTTISRVPYMWGPAIMRLEVIR